ncbi:hypothetical protein [Nocardioides litoris]|uniref:hypothetical protein n=1 Tax=Nocardioides litoris TaxID=1926648 RepID=UPI0011248D3C|nr:hypothetical protein [Nocardioides litoris]
MPPAVRATRPGWRDPRLWVGVAIVAASVLVGSRVLASADDTVQVWAVAADVQPGQQLTEDDLEARRLRFADADDLGRYLEVGEDLPAELVVARPLGAGELLPRSALGEADDETTVTLSLGVAPLLVPTDVTAGSVVDVYVTADEVDGAGPGAGAGGGTGGGAEPRDPGDPVLDDVRVVSAPPADQTVSPGGERQVELAVPREQVGAYYALVGTLTTPVVSLVQES